MKTKKNNLNDLLNNSLSEKQLIVIKGGGEPVVGAEVFVEQSGEHGEQPIAPNSTTTILGKP